jgi:hypothetical protein
MPGPKPGALSRSYLLDSLANQPRPRLSLSAFARQASGLANNHRLLSLLATSQYRYILYHKHKNLYKNDIYSIIL